MKNYKTLATLAATVGVLASSGTAGAATLFADNFNRANDTDLNASTDGKSGSLGALDWLVRNGGAGGASFISDNTLRLGENQSDGSGNNGFATAYLNHNFIDGMITTGGEFTVSVALSNTLITAGGTRFTGFTVGNSLAEVQNWSRNTPAYTSDFFIGYDPTGTKEVRIFTNGSATDDYQQGIDLSAGATLSVRFSGISNFNTGSTVTYEAFINGGTAVKTGTFNWSGTNENYLNVFSNYTHNSGTLDNYSVTVIPEPSAALLGGLGMLALLRRRR